MPYDLTYDDWEQHILKLEALKPCGIVIDEAKHIAESTWEINKRHLQRSSFQDESGYANSLEKTIGSIFLRLSTQPRGEIKTGEVRPAIRLDSAYLLDQIKDWVFDLRQMMFGSKDPPFKTQEEIKTWLLELDNEVRLHLAEEILSVVIPLGFDEMEMYDYIFSGVLPILLTHPSPGIIKRELKLPDGQKMTKQFITVDFYTEPTWEDFITLSKTIRRALKVGKTKMVKEKHVDLFKMVKGYPGAPPKGARGNSTWWEDAAKKLGFKTGRVARNTYLRLEKRLDKNYPKKPARRQSGQELERGEEKESHRKLREYFAERYK